MFSVADMAVAGAVALILFGPDQLPKVARKAGQLVRDVQNTSQSFIRELERAADEHDAAATHAPVPHAAEADRPLPPITDTLPPLIHTPPPITAPVEAAPPPIPAPVVAEASAAPEPIETVAPVRQVAAPIESVGVAQHNAIVDPRDLRADLKADAAADSHAG